MRKEGCSGRARRRDRPAQPKVLGGREPSAACCEDGSLPKSEVGLPETTSLDADVSACAGGSGSLRPALLVPLQPLPGSAVTLQVWPLGITAVLSV